MSNVKSKSQMSNLSFNVKCQKNSKCKTKNLKSKK